LQRGLLVFRLRRKTSKPHQNGEDERTRFPHPPPGDTRWGRNPSYLCGKQCLLSGEHCLHRQRSACVCVPVPSGGVCVFAALPQNHKPHSNQVARERSSLLWCLVWGKAPDIVNVL
jgi:hypothetical protein